MKQKLESQRLLALFVAGCLLLNYPLIALWNREAQLWGLPLFPLALFALWALLIVALACLMERRPD